MENGDARGSHGQAYKDKSKPTDIRSSNINAAKGKRVRDSLASIAVTANACHA